MKHQRLDSTLDAVWCDARTLDDGDRYELAQRVIRTLSLQQKRSLPYYREPAPVLLPPIRTVKKRRTLPTWSLTALIAIITFVLGYAWHFAQVETHPEIYNKQEYTEWR
jgi:hypothetical protein